MAQDQTIDANLEDHAMFRDDIEPESELMAEAEPEWQEDEVVEDAEFPEGEDYPFDPPAESKSNKLTAVMAFSCLAFGLAHAAILLLAPASLEGFASSLANLGLTPAHPMLAGLVFWVMSRQKTQVPLDTTALEDQLRDRFDDFIARIPSSDGSGAGLEDVDRILMALQRQDEKVNNLTRATKMYGKPMVEITTQVGDTANQLKDLAGMIKDLKGSLDLVREQTGKISLNLKPELESFTEKLSQSIDASLAESKKLLASSVEKLMASVAKSPSGDVEDSLRAIQGELSGIATGISQIRNQPAAAPQRAAAPTPAPAAPAAPAAPTPQSTGSGGGTKAPPGGLASSIAGSRKAGGKNVLGAIAKLKNMRK